MTEASRDPRFGDPASDVPSDKWPTLLRERRTFCRCIMPSDFRLLLFFVEDGAKTDWLGLGSRDAYLRAIGLDPEMVGLAQRGLELTVPDIMEMVVDAAEGSTQNPLHPARPTVNGLWKR